MRRFALSAKNYELSIKRLYYSNDVKEQFGPLILGLSDTYLTRPQINRLPLRNEQPERIRKVLFQFAR